MHPLFFLVGLTNWFRDNVSTYRIQNLTKAAGDIYIIFLISVPLSLLLYLIFSRYKHWLLIDLGQHRWLIK